MNYLFTKIEKSTPKKNNGISLKNNKFQLLKNSLSIIQLFKKLEFSNSVSLLKYFYISLFFWVIFYNTIIHRFFGS